MANFEIHHFLYQNYIYSVNNLVILSWKRSLNQKKKVMEAKSNQRFSICMIARRTYEAYMDQPVHVPGPIE